MHKAHQTGVIQEHLSPMELPFSQLKHRVLDQGVTKGEAHQDLRSSPTIEVKRGLGGDGSLTSTAERGKLSGAQVTDFTTIQGLREDGGAPQEGTDGGWEL